MRALGDFPEIVLNDFEYHHGGLGGHSPPVPICGCAWELRSGRQHRLWGEELRTPVPPWPHGPDSLLVSYSAPAELSCYLALGWPLPRFVLDLLIEHRQIVNGVLHKSQPRTLLSALHYYGLPGMEAAMKDYWRDLILAGGPFRAEQREGILEYCWADVEATRQLLEAMRTRLPVDLDRCLYRGRYALAAAVAMRAGIPIDEETWRQFSDHREQIQQEIVQGCPVYEGVTFKQARFEQWLSRRGLLELWPRTKTGRLSTEDQTFRDFSWAPAVEQLRQIRAVIDQLDKPGFEVHQGRNWFAILPFKAESSRNSTLGCIFQAPVWLRGLIQPPPGRALIYADYEQEEFYLAGALAEDPAVLQAYASGDPYMPFGIEAGLMPPEATKKSHPRERAVAKTCVLALQYGAGAPTLTRKAGLSLHRAEDIRNAHRRLFRRTWEWFSLQVQRGRWTGRIDTEYGWRLPVGPATKTGTLRNFRVQGCGAEILRLASIFLMERSIQVVCPVHDAFLIECAEQDLADVVAETERQMIRASECVLNGRRLRVEIRLLRHPGRLSDPRGENTWRQVMEIVSRNEFNNLVGRSVGRYPLSK
jgi:hypothetical protein